MQSDSLLLAPSYTLPAGSGFNMLSSKCVPYPRWIPSQDFRVHAGELRTADLAITLIPAHDFCRSHAHFGKLRGGQAGADVENC